MEVINPEERKIDEPICLMIGNYDGIHLGHQSVIEKAGQLARKHGYKTAVLSFQPHPLKVLAPHKAPRLLHTDAQKRALLEYFGVDYYIVQRFDEAFSRISPGDFVAHLRDHVPFEYILVGFNFRFGHRRKGHLGTLQDLGRRLGFQVIEIEDHRHGNATVSSSRIRDMVRQGDLLAAARLLNRPYFLEGKVLRGANLGKALGTPTANLLPENELLPRFGVYASWARLDEYWHRAITNIGEAPTLDRGAIRVETNLFDFHGSLYGRHLLVCLGARLRSETRFENLETLKNQIHVDVANRLALEDTHPPDFRIF